MTAARQGCIIAGMGKVTVEVSSFVNFSEAAKLLGITRATLYAWVKRGKLHPAIIEGSPYLWRFEVEKLKAEREKR